MPQQSTHGKTSTDQPHSRNSNTPNGARTTGKTNTCPNPGTSAGCSNNYQGGTRTYSQWGVSHGRMQFPQMALNPNMFPFSEVFSGPVQNPMTPKESQHPPNANFMPQQRPASQEIKLRESLATLNEMVTGIVVMCEREPELTPADLRRKMREMFHQMNTKSGNKPQQ